MAYTNPFNATLISGGTQAKQIDDTFRAMHGALIERLNDKLIVDATADPWVLLDAVSGKKNSKFLTIPFNHFLTKGGGSTIIELDHVQTSADAGAIIAGFSLPVGVKVTKAEVYVNATSSVNVEFYKVTGAAPFVKTSVAAWQVTTPGQQVSGSVTLDETTDGLATYYISLDMVPTDSINQMLIYGGRITYNAPTHLNTI